MESVHMRVREEKISFPREEREARSRSKCCVKPVLTSSIGTEIISKVLFYNWRKMLINLKG